MPRKRHYTTFEKVMRWLKSHTVQKPKKKGKK